jgi:hypothetical protein
LSPAPSVRDALIDPEQAMTIAAALGMRIA